MRIQWRLFVVAFGLFCGLILAPARAQTPAPAMPQSASATVQATAKVIAIDYKGRVVTLQDAQGDIYDVTAGPEVKRLNDIKVGDTITMTYQESVALAIAKPGSAMPAAGSSPTITRGTGSKPSGTISQTQTATVTIQSIDMSKPSVTVKTQDGHVITLLVQDKKNLAGLKSGDVVQITYTQALMMSVK